MSVVGFNVGTNDPDIAWDFPTIVLTGSEIRLDLKWTGGAVSFSSPNGDLVVAEHRVTWLRTVEMSRMFKYPPIYDMYRTFEGRTSKIATGQFQMAGDGSIYLGPPNTAVGSGIQGPPFLIPIENDWVPGFYAARSGIPYQGSYWRARRDTEEEPGIGDDWQNMQDGSGAYADRVASGENADRAEQAANEAVPAAAAAIAAQGIVEPLASQIVTTAVTIESARNEVATNTATVATNAAAAELAASTALQAAGASEEEPVTVFDIAGRDALTGVTPNLRVLVVADGVVYIRNAANTDWDYWSPSTRAIASQFGRGGSVIDSSGDPLFVNDEEVAFAAQPANGRIPWWVRLTGQLTSRWAGFDRLDIGDGRFASAHADLIYVNDKLVYNVARDNQGRIATWTEGDGAFGSHRIRVQYLEDANALLREAPAGVYIGGQLAVWAAKVLGDRYPFWLWDDGWLGIDRLRVRELIVDTEPAAVPPNIVLIGDSLTAAAANTAAWQTATGLITVNRGIGGQQSRQISARLSGNVVGVTLSGNQIVSGVNSITAMDGNPIVATSGAWEAQILSTPSDGASRSIRGRFGTVLGVMARAVAGGVAGAAETYTWTPDAGQTLPVICPPGTPFIVEYAALADDYASVAIIGMGRNDDWTDPAPIVANIASVVERFREAGNDRFVVLTPPNGNYSNERLGQSRYTQLLAIEQAIQTRWPQNTFNARRWLIDRGLAALSISPTAQDLIDIADDTVPASLRSDNIHWTSAVYPPLVSAIIEQIITPKGWLP